MDAANNKRKFPGYTLAQLEAAVTEGRGTSAMLQEIADRKAGASVAATVPQLLGGKPQPKLGRM
jgi:hypothetical protein